MGLLIRGEGEVFFVEGYSCRTLLRPVFLTSPVGCSRGVPVCSSGIEVAITVQEELSSTLSVDELAEGDHVDVAIPSRPFSSLYTFPHR